MKIEIDEGIRTFQPFNIIITIESAIELASLYSGVGCIDSDVITEGAVIDTDVPPEYEKKVSTDIFYDLYDSLTTIVEETL